jgi:UDP-GlcNAc:undecaprenyl-phosphate/decaprenyl-phosphate GlcNAc-1-phosphate transferase
MLLSAVLRHLAFCAALALVSAMVVAAMISAGIMDRPDARKAHSRPTPKGGGVGVVVAFMLGITVLYGYADFARLADAYFRGVILASFLIAVVAFLDDLRDWPFTIKLAAQTLAGFAAVGSGLYLRAVNLPYFGTVELGWVGMAATLAWILFVTNAVNFIDGLNGLAAGTALVACAFLAFVAAGKGGWFVYFAAMLLGAGLVGFLPFNFPRARIFMGDVGSQFCGFVLAVLGVAAARFDAVPMSFLLVPCLLSGVLFDVAFTLLRRAAAGERLTQAHRGHLYQVAQRAGMSARWVAALHWGFAALGGLVCIAIVRAPAAGSWLLLPLLLLLPQIAWTGVVVGLARRAGIARW